MCTGCEQLQHVMQQVIGFLFNSVPNSSAFTVATHNMAAGAAYSLLAECVQQGVPVEGTVAIWGPLVCRSGLLLYAC